MTTTRFTKDHEWLHVEGDTGTVGITEYAQKQLGDVVFVELPDIGKQLTQGKDAAVVESVKAASEIYAPVSGTVTDINAALTDQPALVNSSADNTWFFKLKLGDASQVEALMDEDEYKSYVSGLA